MHICILLKRDVLSQVMANHVFRLAKIGFHFSIGFRLEEVVGHAQNWSWHQSSVTTIEQQNKSTSYFATYTISA